MSWKTEIITDIHFQRFADTKLGSRSTTEYAIEGKWWMVRSNGESLITTAKTQEGVKLLAAMGLPVYCANIDQCDSCYGYSFLCAGQEYGPPSDDGGFIPVIWHCYDCVINERK